MAKLENLTRAIKAPFLLFVLWGKPSQPQNLITGLEKMIFALTEIQIVPCKRLDSVVVFAACFRLCHRETLIG